MAIMLLTFAGVVFRSEIAILLVAEVGYLLFRRRVSLTQEVIPAGLIAGVAGLMTAVSIDSFFWQRFPLWPELVGFYYNTVQGKASEWGVSPFHFYFVNALPRLLMNPMSYLVCIPLAMASKTVRQTSQDILIPHLVFIALYSALPHKEWRFIVYSVPAFTAVASSTAGYFWVRRSKSWTFKMLNLVMIASTLLSFIVSLALLYISSLNYPGGEALYRLHYHLDGTSGFGSTRAPISVYLGNLACQTGITRFQQINPAWRYDKTEDVALLRDSTFWQQHDYALLETSDDALGDWRVIDTVLGFAGVTLKPAPGSNFLPFPSTYPSALHSLRRTYSKVAVTLMNTFTRGYWPTVKMEPKIYILQNQARLTQT